MTDTDHTTTANDIHTTRDAVKALSEAEARAVALRECLEAAASAYFAAGEAVKTTGEARRLANAAARAAVDAHEAAMKDAAEAAAVYHEAAAAVAYAV